MSLASGNGVTGNTPKALLVDAGGVMTTDPLLSFDAFCAEHGVPTGAVRAAMLDRGEGARLFAGLERGTLDQLDFERGVAGLLGLPPDDLLAGLLRDVRPDDAMFAAVTVLRAAGIATALVSNSWGTSRYSGRRIEQAFDVVVLSGTEGVRKPDREIYALACERLGVAPTRCVFVDDFDENLLPAARMGMRTVLHRDRDATLGELEALFCIRLSACAGGP